MPDLDRLAEEASRATSRWYGRVARFNELPTAWTSCKDWFLRHWQEHPRASPAADEAFWDGVGDPT